MKTSIHTVPLPAGWSPEQTWEHLSRGGLLEHPPGTREEDLEWVNLEIEGVTYETTGMGTERTTGGRLVRWWK